MPRAKSPKSNLTRCAAIWAYKRKRDCTVMDALICEMNSRRGRIFRIALGAELIAIGLYFSGPLGWLVALVGLVPMVPAFFGRCA